MAGGLLFVTSLPFLTLPRLVKREPQRTSKEVDLCVASDPTPERASISEVKVSEVQDTSAYGQSIRDIPRSIWRLIT